MLILFLFGRFTCLGTFHFYQIEMAMTIPEDVSSRTVNCLAMKFREMTVN